MTCLTLEPANRQHVFDTIEQDKDGTKWIVACLCAAWCDVCAGSRAGFESFAERHPDKYFLWVDVEDQADIIGDLDVDNFPTLLIQRGDTVAFYGTVVPDWNQAHRLLEAQVAKDIPTLMREAGSTQEKINWQQQNNLRQRLRDVM